MRKLTLGLFICGNLCTWAATAPTPTGLVVTGTGTITEVNSDFNNLDIRVALNGTVTTTAFGSGTITGSGSLAVDKNNNYITTGTFTVVFPGGNTLSGNIDLSNNQ